MRFLIAITSFGLATFSAAQSGDNGEAQEDPIPIDQIAPAPVLSPEEALAAFQVEPGFKIELVASEPMIEDPVAIRFDADGRLWVVELRGYMPDIDGHGEDAPVGRIVILEDTDHDGKMDTSKVFLDGLNQARAISLVEGGILYCEPPGLYFVEKTADDQAGARTLIDPDYCTGGNIEHKPNGLIPALDNWIYSAKSDRRYRKIDGEWVMEKTEPRGQWGIAQDDFGRLYHNTNSSGLRGDSAPPSLLLRNPHFKSKRGINIGLGSNNIASIHPNPGVNRAYRKGMLHEDGKLKKFTAACGPVVFRSPLFGEGYFGDAFVAEPAANLIKRYELGEKSGHITGSDATPNRSFLASTDERFRPVSLDNAPDGSLYVVDFYRGIIQHKTYVTSYLRRQILHRGLENPLGLGRIYRIVPQDFAQPPAPKLSELNTQALVAKLSAPDGWTRDTAQHLLIQQQDKSAITLLRKPQETTLGQIHALWVLEGMGAIDDTHLAKIASGTSHPKVLATIARHTSSISLLAKLAESEAPDVRLALAFRLGQIDDPKALSLLANIVNSTDDLLVSDAAVSGLAGRESAFLAALENPAAGLEKNLEAIIAKVEKGPQAETQLAGKNLESYHRGKGAYTTTCFACHGADGQGITPIAPPLARSEWVTGSTERLAHIILNGLQGPITVNGIHYAPPEIQPIMPGLGLTPGFDDQTIADIMTYTRNAWGNQAPAVSAKEVAAHRASAKKGIYTPEELMAN